MLDVSLIAHPETQTAETNSVEDVSLPEKRTSVGGSEICSGAAVTKDAAKAERKRRASMSLGPKKRGEGKMGNGMKERVWRPA